MLAGFVLKEPTWVAVALVAAAAAAAYQRWRPTPGATSAAVGSRHAGAVLAALLVGAGVAGLALLLLGAPTPAGSLCLLLAAVAAAVTLSVQSYRRVFERLSSLGAWCLLARILAWAALLLLIARPAWEWVVVEWDKPLVAVVLDQSRSMSIVDRGQEQAGSRAQRAAAALSAARDGIDRLHERYEVRLFGAGATCEPLEDWEISADSPLTALAAGLRRAAQSRSSHGEPPAAILLLSDGGENAADARTLAAVADELTAQRTALVAIGVGPSAHFTPAVVFEPLAVPTRVGGRDRLHVPVAAQVSGCQGHELELSILWDGQIAVGERRAPLRRRRRIGEPLERVSFEFDLLPPGVGLHRLTARATLPGELCSFPFETSIVVDVRDEQIRVLVVDSTPRSESAFAIRALRGEPRFAVSQRLLFAERKGRTTTLPRWSDYDVVILGGVDERDLPREALAELADAVRDDGVGLLLAGGREFFHNDHFARSALREISPVEPGRLRPPDGYRPHFLPTELGLRHPVLTGVAAGNATAGSVWQRLPGLSGAARFGPAKPLAAVLATDEERRPLLVGIDVGQGRCLAAAWDTTWPWALWSEEGLAVQRLLWRQMTSWLANRRPVAWVITGRTSYLRAALAEQRQQVEIQAGVSGLEAWADRVGHAEFDATLQLRRVWPAAVSQPPAPPPQPWSIPLTWDGVQWRAALPRDLPARDWLADGRYELVFTVTAARPGTDRPLTLSARTGFEVSSVDPELVEPSANLLLLEQAAARTAAVGGAYFPLEQLPDALKRLTAKDRRRRIEHPATYELTERQPWLLLALAVGALALEWSLRKPAGLA